MNPQDFWWPLNLIVWAAGSFRNAMGHLRGYKGCLHCGATWDHAKGHQVNYRCQIPGASVLRQQTVLCERCWGSQSPQERLEYHRDHCALEAEQGRPVTTVDWYGITEAIMKEGK